MKEKLPELPFQPLLSFPSQHAVCIYGREAAILDCGAETLKAGYSGDDAPSVTIANTIGYEGGKGQGGASYVGEEAMERDTSLQMYQPVDHGIVSDWVEMEAIWRYL